MSKDKEKYDDIFVVPLTSKIHNLSDSEFVLSNWKEAGLNVPTAVKRDCILVDSALVIKKVGALAEADLKFVNNTLKSWFDLN